MKRPSLNLLVIFLSGLLFTSCYKNDLRALYDYWTNQVNLVGINSEDSSAVAILADNRGNRAYYVPSNQDAYFVFNLKNEKDYFIKARFENDYIKNLTGDDKFSWESQGDNGIYNDDIKIANKIKVIVPQKFLVKNEGETYNVKVAIESCGKGKPSATLERDFTDDINFTFTINTPPEYKKHIFI